METRAHYAVIGAFVLAVILGAFGFVYWLRISGGLGEQASYRIQFAQPVSGLTAGSNVLFNGIKVGAVKSLDLDPADPERLVATISVEPSLPIHADTRVDITYQGFAGSPAILLRGGSAAAPRLMAHGGQPPLLIAPVGIGDNVSDSARKALQHLDQILTDNAKPLHTAITGISTFADMLGRNSKRVEAMLGGLEKLTGTGGSKETPQVYDLAAATSFPALGKTIQAPVTIPDPHTILAFDTQKILIRSAAGVYTDVENARWADNLPKLMQARLVDSFENAHQLSAVSRPFDQLDAAYRLELNIRNFQIGLAPKPAAIVAFSARILGGKGKVAAARMFSVSVPAKSTQAADAVPALNQAFTEAASQLVAWTVDRVDTLPPPAADAMDKPGEGLDVPLDDSFLDPAAKPLGQDKTPPVAAKPNR